MKKILPQLLLISVLLIGVQEFTYAQCGSNTTSGTNCTPRLTSYYGEMVPDSAWVPYLNYGPGTYFRMPVLLGGCYSISTCGNTMDTQITGYEGSNTTTPFFWDDQDGPHCPGNPASVIFTPTFSDFVRVNVNEYNCLPGGSSSITVHVRQENNLSFTSPNAAMYPGDSRVLAAIPVPAPAGQLNSGDTGSFAGTGVSGKTFTAPTPVGASNDYDISYTFGYVTVTQTITVYRDPIANAGPNVTTTNNFVTTNANLPFGTGLWTKISGGGTIANPSDPSTLIAGLDPGPNVFRWTVTNGPGTPAFDEVTFTYNAGVGIEDDKNLSNIQIVPNPSDGLVKIEMPGLNESGNIEILNSVGKRVYYGEIHSNNGLGMTEIDLRNLASGQYTVYIEAGDMKGSEKLIIR